MLSGRWPRADHRSFRKLGKTARTGLIADHSSHARVDRRSTARSGIGPTLRNQSSMKTQQCRRRDQEGTPRDARQQPTRSRQEQSVGRPKRRPTNLPAQHRQLVTKDDDLETPVVGSAGTTRKAARNTATPLRRRKTGRYFTKGRIKTPYRQEKGNVVQTPALPRPRPSSGTLRPWIILPCAR